MVQLRLCYTAHAAEILPQFCRFNCSNLPLFEMAQTTKSKVRSFCNVKVWF